MEDAEFQTLTEDLVANTIYSPWYFDFSTLTQGQINPFFDAFKVNTSVVSFTACGMRDNHVEKFNEILPQNTGLSTLQFRGNQITANGFEKLITELIKNKNITVLNFFNDLGPEAAINLARLIEENTSLTELYLGNNRLADDGACKLANALKKNTTLQALSLSSNDITNASCDIFIEMLKVNKSLSFLNFSDNQMRNGCGKKIAAMLLVNNTLEQLHLFDNEVSSADATKIADALRLNTCMMNLSITISGHDAEKIKDIHNHIKQQLRYNQIIQKNLQKKHLQSIAINNKIFQLLKEKQTQPLLDKTSSLFAACIPNIKNTMMSPTLLEIAGDCVRECIKKDPTSMHPEKHLLPTDVVEKINNMAPFTLHSPYVKLFSNTKTTSELPKQAVWEIVRKL